MVVWVLLVIVVVVVIVHVVVVIILVVVVVICLSSLTSSDLDRHQSGILQFRRQGQFFPNLSDLDDIFG